MKKIFKSRFIFLIITLFAFMFNGCEKYTFEKPKIVIEKNVKFSEDVIPIFTSKCIGCHNGSIKLDLRSNKAYTSLFNTACVDTTISPSENKIYMKLTESGSSHVGRASDTEIATILKWIELGAKNN